MSILSFTEALQQGDDFLKRYDSALDSEQPAESIVTEMASELCEWIAQSVSLGVRLGSPVDRQMLQGRINYWTSVLSRFGIDSGVATLSDYDEEVGEDIAEALCPYPGLRPCRAGDVFVGREDDVANYCSHIQQSALLAIVGLSGAGKSSIVIAGMLPLLQKGPMRESEGWVYLRRQLESEVPLESAEREMRVTPGITPGGHPIHSLVQAVCSSMGQPCGEAGLRVHVDRLLAFPTESATWLREILPNRRVFLFVDQFEELFSVCNDTRERSAFETALVAILLDTEGGHRVVLTMRTDHLTVFERMFPDLHGLAVQNLRRPNRMTLNDLRRVIEVPARSTSPELQFSPSTIVDELAHEAHQLVSALPLLQFALRKLWRHRQHDKITRESRRQLPSVERSLAATANDLYKALTGAQQLVCRRMMIELAVIVALEEPLRRRVAEANLVQRLTKESLEGDPASVIAAFCEAGLLVRTGSGEEAQIEVAHEALFRNWDLFLEEWLPAEKNDMLLRQRTESDAQEWRIAIQNAEPGGAGGTIHPEDLLSLKGERLQAALRLSSAGRLDPYADEFVAACVSLQEAHLRKEEAAKKAEESATTARYQLRLVIILSVVACFIYWAVSSARRDVDLLRMTSLGHDIAAFAAPPTTLDFAYTSARGLGSAKQSKEARIMLSQALDATDFWRFFDRKDIGGFFSTAGRYFIQLKTTDPNFWSVSKIEEKTSITLPTGAGNDLTGLQYSDVTPDGRYAVMVLNPSTPDISARKEQASVWICSLKWDTKTIDCPDNAKHRLEGMNPVSVAMDVSGHRLVIAVQRKDARDLSLISFDLRGGDPRDQPALAGSYRAGLKAIGLPDSGDGPPVIGFDDGSVLLPSGYMQSGSGAPIQQFVVGPDKSTFLTYSDDFSLRAWHAETKPITLLKGKGNFTSAKFNQKGDRIVAVVDGAAVCWRAVDGGKSWKQYECGDHSPVFQAAFSSDSDSLMWVAKDKVTGALIRLPASPVRQLLNWVSLPSVALTFAFGSKSADCPIVYKDFARKLEPKAAGVSMPIVEPLELTIDGVCGGPGVPKTEAQTQMVSLSAPALAPEADTNNLPVRSEFIFNAAPSPDGQWLAYATAKRVGDEAQLGNSEIQSVYVVNLNDKPVPVLFLQLPSSAVVEKLSVSSRSVGLETERTLAAAAGDTLYLASRKNTQNAVESSKYSYAIPKKKSIPDDKFSCLAFSMDGTRLVAGTASGDIYTGTLVNNEWRIASRVADPRNRLIPATIVACSINAHDQIAVGTIGGDVFRLPDEKGQLKRLTGELRRLADGVESVAIGEDGRVAALGQRPQQLSGQRQRLLVWQSVNTDAGAVVIDLLLPAPIFAIGLTPDGVDYLTERGWVARICHACATYEQLLRDVEDRNPKLLTLDQQKSLADGR